MSALLVSATAFISLVGAIALTFDGFQARRRWRWYALVGAFVLPLAWIEVIATLA